MTPKKLLTPAFFFLSLIAITLCITLNNAPLHAAEQSLLSDTNTSASSWLPENSTANPASSTSRKHILTGDSYLVAEGKASYYNKRFHGKTTASGESFNRNRFTAAHRTLPFGTSVNVINLDNGKNVVVRINDRGPHMTGRIIDVSPAAAREIGLFGNGTAHVRIEAYD
jgi:rare lipoprotein A